MLHLLHKDMTPSTAVATTHHVSGGMDVHNTGDAAQLVSYQLSRHPEISTIRAPDFHLPRSHHGPRHQNSLLGRVPGQPQWGQPSSRLVVVLHRALGRDGGLHGGGVVQPQLVVAGQGGHLVPSDPREDAA